MIKSLTFNYDLITIFTAYFTDNFYNLTLAPTCTNVSWCRAGGSYNLIVNLDSHNLIGNNYLNLLTPLTLNLQAKNNTLPLALFFSVPEEKQPSESDAGVAKKNVSISINTETWRPFCLI